MALSVKFGRTTIIQSVRGYPISIASQVPLSLMNRGVDPRRGGSSRKNLEERPRERFRSSSSAAATKRRSTSSQNRVTSSNTYLLRQLRKKKALSHTRSRHGITPSRSGIFNQEMSAGAAISRHYHTPSY